MDIILLFFSSTKTYLYNHLMSPTEAPTNYTFIRVFRKERSEFIIIFQTFSPLMEL